MVILDPVEGVRFGKVKCLDDMYREIGCDTIDITTRMVGGKSFDFIVDDEGLFKENPQISAVYAGDPIEPALVGTLIICSHDTAGRTIDISLDDHMLICDKIGCLVTKNKKTGKAHTNYVIQLDRR